ncbi:alpha/beta hydrolase fold protein [Setomelanomma holmii]|uniref:Alpha/beta hydrolase fold protein n=1 Tax=Setomelanomma holmii TaxID=210430 RepID=A0A9P4HP35_9PLEO|nr:alpha/beta hydrolase fold protein [Setomelanomma holmii]
MSLLSSLHTWLFNSPPPSNTSSIQANLASTPCRFPLDNSTSSTHTLPDGRKIGYAQYGSPTGKPILYNHGFPGSRLEAAQFDDLGRELGLRIIAIDRPGIGWSSPHPGAKLLDWPKDVEHLAESLNLEKYAVMGASGGGPATLACAFALPSHKLSAAALVCSMGPPDIGMKGADWAHWIGWPYGIRYAPYWTGRMFWRSSAIGRLDLPDEKRVEMFIKEGASAIESERNVLTDVNFARLSCMVTREAFAQGYDYVWDDGKMSCRDFGFRVQDIRKDLEVQLWYGMKDTFVPLVHGLQIAARLGEGAELRVEDEAHAGILVHWKREILEGLRRSI